MREREGIDRLARYYGLRLGAGAGVLGLPVSVFGIFGAFGLNCGLLALSGVAFLLLIWLLFESGRITTMRTGAIADGVVAGAIAGALAGVGYSFWSIGMLCRLNLVGSVRLLFSAIMFAGFGAGLGVLGGLVAQSRLRRAQPTVTRPATPGA